MFILYQISRCFHRLWIKLGTTGNKLYETAFLPFLQFTLATAIDIFKGWFMGGPIVALIWVALLLTDDRFVEVEVLLKTLQPGDLIEFDRRHYSHWAMYSDIPGEVFNVPAESKNDTKVTITRQKLIDVARGDKVRKDNQQWIAKKLGYRARARWEALKKANSDVGKTFEYDIKRTNCEYYCTKWVYEEGFSRQVIETAIHLLPTGAVAQLLGFSGGMYGAYVGGLFGAGIGYMVGCVVVFGLSSGIFELMRDDVIYRYFANKIGQRMRPT